MSYQNRAYPTKELDEAARLVRKDLSLAMVEIKKAKGQIGGPSPYSMIELGCISFSLLPALHALLAYQDCAPALPIEKETKP